MVTTQQVLGALVLLLGLGLGAWALVDAGSVVGTPQVLCRLVLPRVAGRLAVAVLAVHVGVVVTQGGSLLGVPAWTVDAPGVSCAPTGGC